MDEFFSGKKLYGDNFSENEIAEWFADEAEAYADLGARDSESYRYGYHALNYFHAFRHLRGHFPHVLGFGSAYGDEFLPIISRIGTLTIIDPSDAFRRESIHGVPAHYIKPARSGKLPLPGASFDLVTCLDALHHIPTVTATVRELARVLKKGGTAIVREPIISMGDWRESRPGLTKRERGIPLPLLTNIVNGTGLSIEHRSLCAFPVTQRLFNGLRARTLDGIFNRMGPTLLDAALCRLFAWNTHYHPRTLLQKLCPHSVFFVLRKPHDAV